MHAIDQGSPIKEDQDILVMGAGIIGLLATILLASKKIRNITVMELSDHRRETVQKMKLPGVRAVHPADVSVCRLLLHIQSYDKNIIFL